jgi:competence protein ComEC
LKPKEFWHNGDSVDTPAYNELMNIIESKKTKILLPSDLYKGRDISGVKIELLHPTPGSKGAGSSYEDRDINNNSLVLKITYNGISFLFPGDIETQSEEKLVSNAGSTLDSDIFLVPHHGSRNSSTTLFLKAISPKICVISSGKGNRFGFPHRETIKRLRETGCRIIWIDEVGTVQVKAGGADRYEVRSFIE